LVGGAGNDTFAFATANLTAADTISGGDGTDSISMTDDATVVDADFTKATSVEVLTAGANVDLAATIGSLAQAAGLTTVTFDGNGAGDTVTIGADFTANITVNLDVDDAGNTVNATAFTKSLTVVADSSEVDTTASTITGGTGSDTLQISVTANAAALMASVTNVETVKLVDGDTTTVHTQTVTLNNGNATYTDASTYQTITVDASSLVSDIATINATAEVDGKVVIIGGGAADVITGSASTKFGDNIDGGAGNDTIGFAAVSSFTTADTINGGFGTDSLDLSAVVLEATTSLDDSAFAGLTSIETFKAWTFNDAGDNSTSAITATISLGTKAQTAGITTIALSATDGSTTQANNADTYTFIVDASAYTTGVTVTTNHAAAAGSASNTLNVQVTTGTGNDTITAAAGDDAITVNGGAAPIPLT